MEIKLVRGKASAISVEGKLYVDGVFECYTVEDAPKDVKVYGKTGIPKGKYKVIVTTSTRFGKRLPLLLDVPGFKGIRIHAGNAANKVIATATVMKDKAKPVLTSSEFIEVY